MNSNLIKKAKSILDNNWKDGFTIPSENLYPFQWKWDSGLIAIGYANYDIEKAKKELITLTDAQWANGFIPHIIFHNESSTYFPGPDVHQSILHPQASKEFKSTGMTQPPITGFVLEEIYNRAEDKYDILNFIKTIIDKIYFNHEYLYNNRDPHNEGLVYIYHNWESGTDNSPIWDDIWTSMDSPEYKFERRDTSHIDPSQRPSNREYDHYLHIIEIAKRYRYDDAQIAKHSPFLIQDPLFNAMLIKSNKSLINLYKRIGDNLDKIQQLQKWQELSAKTFNNKLFNESLGAYVHYDLKNETHLNFICSSSFAPLFSGIPSKDKADIIVKTMINKFGSETNYLCASFDPTHERFEPQRYWRGPVWINLNWIIYHGLKEYGFNDLAVRMRKDTLELIEKYGFYEYFDPRKESGGGYGGNNFSWTAALYIDLLNN